MHLLPTQLPSLLAIPLLLALGPIALDVFERSDAAAHQDPPAVDRPAGEGQERKEGQEGDQKEQAAPALIGTTKVDALARALLAANGGVEALGAFKSLQFTLVPVTIVAKQDPGAAAGTPPTYEELRGNELRFEAKFGGEKRMLRLDEPKDVSGRVVMTSKILRCTAAGDEPYLLLDGKRRNMLRDQKDQVIQDIRTVAGQLDILLGLVNGQLRANYDGRRERDGVEYETVTAAFQSAADRDRAFRLFINGTTSTIERYEVHDLRTRMINAIVKLTDYGTYEGIRIPSTLVFHDRDGLPLLRWELSGILVNAEIDAGRFSVESPDVGTGEKDGEGNDKGGKDKGGKDKGGER